MLLAWISKVSSQKLTAMAKICDILILQTWVIGNDSFSLDF